MKIIIISIHSLALGYLKDSFNDKQLKKVTLITDKLTTDLKNFLKFNNIKYITTKKLSVKILEKLDLKRSIIISAGSP